MNGMAAQGLAFDVPLHENPEDESLIKQHPSNRLQRLEEQQVYSPTLQELENKLAEAEIRR